MTRIVDLSAVSRTRGALRALAAEHPELTEAAARARLASWIEGDDDMASQKNPLDKSLFIRVSAEDIARLDALAERIPIATRHAIAREALRVGLGIIEDDPMRILAAAPPKRRKAR